MRCLIALLFAVVAGCVSLRSVPCKNAETTLEMRECFSASLGESQKELDVLVATVSEQMRDDSGAKESEEFTLLNNEWSIWADKLCSNQRKLFGRGSIAGINYIACKTQLINSQLKLYRSIYIDSMNAE